MESNTVLFIKVLNWVSLKMPKVPKIVVSLCSVFFIAAAVCEWEAKNQEDHPIMFLTLLNY